MVKIDKGAIEYCNRLSSVLGQMRSIGTNYNQVTKAIHINFNERRAVALLAKLERYTLELQILDKQIVRLSEHFDRKCMTE